MLKHLNSAGVMSLPTLSEVNHDIVLDYAVNNSHEAWNGMVVKESELCAVEFFFFPLEGWRWTEG
jgi:hypothetical protein